MKNSEELLRDTALYTVCAAVAQYWNVSEMAELLKTATECGIIVGKNENGTFYLYDGFVQRGGIRQHALATFIEQALCEYHERNGK